MEPISIYLICGVAIAFIFVELLEIDGVPLTVLLVDDFEYWLAIVFITLCWLPILIVLGLGWLGRQS